MNNANDGDPLPTLVFNISQICEILGVSRWQIYQLINSRQLKTIKIGRRRLVASGDLFDYIATLRKEGEE